MGKKVIIKHRLNILNLFISIIVFGTGLLLLFKFHVGEGAHREEWLGLEKEFYLLIHQASAIGFFIGSVAHIQMHWKYIKMIIRQWRVNLPKKIKKTTSEQILLLIAGLIVMWAGFFPWITKSVTTIENEAFHDWIDIHNLVGIILLIGMTVHIIRRWRRIFRLTIKHNSSKYILFQKPTNQKQMYQSREKAMKLQRNSTKYIYANTHKCKACWACIDECQAGVFGKVSLWFHKHVAIRNPEECCGCKSCVDICPNGVFEPVTYIRTAVNQ